jgi:hypothetical protein
VRKADCDPKIKPRINKNRTESAWGVPGKVRALKCLLGDLSELLPVNPARWLGFQGEIRFRGEKSKEKGVESLFGQLDSKHRKLAVKQCASSLSPK